MPSRRRVVWTEAEKSALIQAGQSIRTRSPHLSLLAVLRGAQTKVLPSARHRTVIAISFVPWFTAGLQTAAKKDAELSLSSSLEEEAYPEEPIVSADMEGRLISKISGPVLAKLDELERLLFRIASAPGSSSESVTHTETTQRLPRIAIIGPTDQQAAELLKAAENRVNLTVITKERAASGPLGASQYDRVILWTKFLSHAICGRVAKNYPKEKIITYHGGMSRLVDLMFTEKRKIE